MCAATSSAWRLALAQRLRGWDRDAFVPLRVALSAEEQLLHASAAPSLLAGFVRRDRLERLRAFTELFDVNGDRVFMRPAFPSAAERTRAFQQVAAVLHREDAFPLWQNELYASKTAFGAPTLFHYHRGVDAFFGLSQYATHLNGFVSAGEHGGRRVSHVWIAKRSATKKKWPGLLDTVAGGGLPALISAHDNMVKEADEEAGLDPTWVSAHIVSTGSIDHVVDEHTGLPNNTMFVYDLELPRDAQPVNRDGEVESFELWTVGDVVAVLWAEPERFKPDIRLVLLDFVVRHGVLTPDNFRDFQALQSAIRTARNPYADGDGDWCRAAS